jgi:malate dehydrogenase (oxaloacetate-decarboxylating)
MHEVWQDADGWHTRLRGRHVFSDPRINKGTAFDAKERDLLGLVGLMPPRIMHLEEQAARSYAQFEEQPSDLAKNVFMTGLHDRNEVLFFRLLTDHLREMLPIVYTPTVGEAIERYSHAYRKPRGIFLSVDDSDRVERSLAASELDPDEVDLIVATDGEAILGIGDWGVGGMDIAVGKLVVYTAAGGLDPHRTVPVVLDVGTNRRSLLDDPLYLGVPHPRVPRDVYDAFIDRYVTTATRLFPHALLHWEDFGPANARRILERYRHQVLTFNDDMQGTGAVMLAALLTGLRVTKGSLAEQRFVVFGAGTAGIGVADQLRDAISATGISTSKASAQIWCIDRDGLIVDDMGSIRDFQRGFVRHRAETRGWRRDERGDITLAEVVRQVEPTVLIGTSGCAGAFSEDVVREMARHVERPLILPMSNPTRLSEAKPDDLIAWTEGRALVATGSPFPPVTYEKTTHVIGQANNALAFPGLGLGVVVSRASRVTDAMLFAAAEALSTIVDPTTPGAPLLPMTDDLRAVSATVAAAVALAAVNDGVAGPLPADVDELVRRTMWVPEYRPVLPA